MKAKEAKVLFRGKDKLNCAQAVLKAFQPESGMPDNSIRAAVSAGCGKAEGGICGSLYAARVLLNNQDFSQNLEHKFKAKAGSLICKKIRKLKKLTCRECVGLSAQLLEQYMKTNPQKNHE